MRIKMMSAVCCYGCSIAWHQALGRLHTAAPWCLDTACQTCSSIRLHKEYDSSLPCNCDPLKAALICAGVDH